MRRKIWDNHKVLIVSLHGYCMAAGMQFVSLSDFAIAADDCVFGWPRLPLGGGYLGPLFASVFGIRRAKEMDLMPGPRFTAQEALERGVVNRLAPADRLAEATAELASGIAKTPPDLLALRKASINSAFGQRGLEQALAAAPEWDAIAHVLEGPTRARGYIKEMGLRDAIDKFLAEGM